MITAEIKMGDECHTITHGKTIEEVLEKIRQYHVMDIVADIVGFIVGFIAELFFRIGSSGSIFKKK